MRPIATALLLVGLMASLFPQLTAAEGDARAAITATPRQRMLLDTADIRPWTVDFDVSKLIAVPRGQGNAAEQYAKLEQLYPADRVSPEEYEVKPDAKGLDAVLLGAQCRTSRLTPDFYPLMETGTALQPDLIVFQSYLFAILKKAKDLDKSGQSADADRVYQAALVWGAHLLAERPNLLTYLIGLSIEANASKQYARFLQRQLKVEQSLAMHKYHEQLLQQRTRTYQKAQIHLGEFRNFDCLMSAVKIATEDPEPMWRQEAVLRLGVLRHGAPNADDNVLLKHDGYQKMAEEGLKLVAEKDGKEWIRKLALWSIQNVTPERFADMRRMSLFSPEARKQPPEKK